MTLQKVKEMIANQLNLDIEKVTDDSKLVADLGADSLDMIEMLMALEEEFNISVPDDKAEELKTVAQIAAFIDSQLKKD